MSIYLVDPSLGPGLYFQVTCFVAPRHKDLLPNIEVGQVILLRNVRNQPYIRASIGVNGVVYQDKLKWIGYDPTNGKYFFPEKLNLDAKDDGFDPFYKVEDPRETDYIVRLGEWRRAIKEEGNFVQIQVGAGRINRCIGDCMCNEFFDTMFEVSTLTTSRRSFRSRTSRRLGG